MQTRSTVVLSCPAFRTESSSLDSSPFMGGGFSVSSVWDPAHRHWQTEEGRRDTFSSRIKQTTFKIRLNEYQLYSLGNHLRSELRLLFGDGGAEGAALSDPVWLHRPEHRNKKHKDIMGGSNIATLQSTTCNCATGLNQHTNNWSETDLFKWGCIYCTVFVLLHYTAQLLFWLL